MLGQLTSYGQALERAATNLFEGNPAASGVFDEGPSEFEVGVDPRDADFPVGKGFELSFMHYKNPAMHSKPYFFTTQLGSPFPSYHSNPLPKFPARWTLINGVKPPCENLTAPRIRLAPQELVQKTDILRKMAECGVSESTQPHVTVLNLSHQALGDPYQYQALAAFLAVNRFVEVLNLNDNELEDITDLEPYLENVRVLHVGCNNFVTFDSLPKLPKCEELYLKNNFVSGFVGFTSSRFPSLKVIDIDLNPIEHVKKLEENIRDRVPTVVRVIGAEHGRVEQ